MSYSQLTQQIGIRQRSIRGKFMRATELVFVLAIGSAVVVSLPGSAQAQALEWDANGATSNGSVEGGSGIWDAATANWTADGGTSNVAWSGGSDAVFGGSAGTVTVSGTQAVENMTFLTDGYLLTGGALTYTDSATGIDLQTGTATI